MCPRFSVNDLEDVGLTHSEQHSEGFQGVATRGVQGAYLQDLSLGELVAPVTLALRSSPLRSHVFHVLGLRSEPKVLDVATRRSVPARAVVENGSSGGNRSVSQLPNKAVRSNELPIDFCLSVTVLVRTSSPQQAACNRRDRAYFCKKTSPALRSHLFSLPRST